MSTLTISIADRDKRELEERAERLGVRAEDLAELSVKSLLFQDPGEFERAMEYVLAKNEELYRRLA